MVLELDTGKNIIKITRTLINLYILKGGQEQCYLWKYEENQLWHKRLGLLSFSPLQDEIECSFCNKFGHEEFECRRKRQPKISTNSKVWKKKDLQFKSCDIDLFVDEEENKWYIDSRCSKHMTSDSDKLISYNALEK